MLNRLIEGSMSRRKIRSLSSDISMLTSCSSASWRHARKQGSSRFGSPAKSPSSQMNTVDSTGTFLSTLQLRLTARVAHKSLKLKYLRQWKAISSGLFGSNGTTPLGLGLGGRSQIKIYFESLVSKKSVSWSINLNKLKNNSVFFFFENSGFSVKSSVFFFALFQNFQKSP